MGTPGAASPACPDGAPKPGFALRSSPSPPSSRGRRQDSSSAAFALKVGDASQRVQNHKAQKENKEKTLQNMALPETAQGSAPGAASRLHSTGGKGKYKRPQRSICPERTCGSQPGPELTCGSQPGPEHTCGSQAGPERTCGSQAGPERTCGSQPGSERTCGSQAGPERTCGSQAGPERTCGSQPGPERTCGSQPGPECTCGSQAGPERTCGSQAGPECTCGSQPGSERTCGSQAGPELTCGSKAGCSKLAVSWGLHQTTHLPLRSHQPSKVPGDLGPLTTPQEA
ncbi:hypothetical protein E5288_WYG018669 [Bos mutus]|uniref:Uncharacterized protein n=1 Tax=Bos mutus TaxID=72004 RepID=A0A6B0R2L6_9CETA|nr:hypothetical protein [Bos mutus]